MPPPGRSGYPTGNLTDLLACPPSDLSLPRCNTVNPFPPLRYLVAREMGRAGATVQEATRVEVVIASGDGGLMAMCP